VKYLVFNHILPPRPRVVVATSQISSQASAAVGSRPGILACSAPSPVPRLPTAMTLPSVTAATTPTPSSPARLSTRPPRQSRTIQAPSIQPPEERVPRPHHGASVPRQHAICDVFPPPTFSSESSVDPENLHLALTNPAAVPSIWPAIAACIA